MACRSPLTRAAGDDAPDCTGDAHDRAGRARPRAQPGRCHGVGDPLGADPGLCDLRRGPGGGVQGRDGPTAARRLPPLPDNRLRALLFRALLRPQMVREAREQADRGLVGVMEGHAAMDMSVTGGSLWSRIRSPKGFAAISHYFVMDWVSVGKDIAAGLLIAGALGAWVPASFWEGFFLVDHPLLARLWGPLVGPLVVMLSFVCSIGNVPLAAVLWNGGISFGGVIAFIFADLIVLPILNIYRKYYGRRMSLF